MAESLPIPFYIPEPGIQGNFDALKKRWPISRKDLKLEAPNEVGVGSNPTFSGTWVNYDTGLFHGAAFWKDPLDMVHIRGLVKDGTINTTVFTLPSGYRPANGLIFASLTNTGVGDLRIAATGNVLPFTGGTGWFTLNCSFRRAL